MTTITQRREALNATIIKAGGIVRFAKDMGVSHQAVTSWRKKGHVTLERAVQIEGLYGTARDSVLDPYLLEMLSRDTAADAAELL